MMRGANLLVDVDALAMLGHAIGELSRAPVLGLFNLAALFGAGVLDAGDDFLDFVFRRGGTSDEDQVVQTLFHDCLFPSVSGRWPVKTFASLPTSLKTRHYIRRAEARRYVSASPSAGLRRLNFVIAASSPSFKIISIALPASSSISAAISSSAFFIGRRTYSFRLLSWCSGPQPSRSLANSCVPTAIITDFAPLWLPALPSG